VKQDERIYGATLLDVAPTILTLFGLPIGEDMDGRVLVHAFEEPPEIERIPSWEEVPGECGMHPADLRMDPAAAEALLQQFVALGYIHPPSEDQQKAVATAVKEQKYNLARVYLDSRRAGEALSLLEELAKDRPEEVRFAQHLAQCYLALGRRAEAKLILQRLIVDETQERHADGLGARVSRPPEASRIRSESSADHPQQAGGTPALPGKPFAAWLMGVIHFEEGNLEEALACLHQAEQAEPRLPALHQRIGETYMRQKRLDDAERAFLKALEIDGDSPEAHLGLARVRLCQRRNEEAAEEALLAVSLQHFLPMGHFYLGVALARLGHPHRAALAFETALTTLPGLIAAHRWLVALYSQPGGDLARAREHRRIFAELRRLREAGAGSQ
jgi:tetratricopeptide (TPR) repeat protein